MIKNNSLILAIASIFIFASCSQQSSKSSTKSSKGSSTTGWKYNDSNSEYREYQFCYFLKRSAGRISDTRVNLADLEDGEYTSYVNSNLAREVSITQNNLKKAEEKCQWAGT